MVLVVFLVMSLVVIFVVVVVFFLHGQRLDALGSHHHGALIAGCADQAFHPALEAEPVDDQQFRPGDGSGVPGGRLVDVGVATGPHQGGDAHPLPSHLAHQVAEDAERCDHVEPFGGAGLPFRKKSGRQDDRGKQ